MLKKKKQNFELETELAEAETEEEVYSHCEEQSPPTPSSQLPTSHETKTENTVDVPECQENLTLTPAAQFSTFTPCQDKDKETVEVPIYQMEKDYSPLNPDACEWKGYKHLPSTSNCESAEGRLLEQHLDLSHKNVSRTIEV